MATFKFSGSLRYHDDNKLWKEVVRKERYAKQEYLDRSATDMAFSKTIEHDLGGEAKKFTKVRPKSGLGY